MTKRDINTCEIVDFNAWKTSSAWNPSYIITLKDEQNNIWTWKTASNAWFVYWLNLSCGQIYKIESHETKANIIIDWIEKLDIKHKLEHELREYISLDLYNMLLENKKRPDKRTILFILKERGEIGLLYSLALNF